VVDANGARLTFVRALLRNLAKIISSLPFGLGFLLAAFTPRKQALHDLITKCLVVRAGPSQFLKAVIATVGALVISIAGGYYYFTEVYLPQMAEEMGRQMEKGMKQAQKGAPVARPAPGQPPVAKAPAPAPAQPAPGEPRIMTPQEIAEFEKKMAEAKREPAKVAAATSPAPAPVAKETAPKPSAAPAAAAKPEPKPESKPATVAAAKPKPKPAAAPAEELKAPAPVAQTPLVSEPPASPAERHAPAPERRVQPPAPAALPAVVITPPSRAARSPKFNDIMTAVMFRDSAAVAELLEYGWWVDRPDSNGLTPLMAAAWNGDAAMTQLLLKAGADSNRYARGGSVLDYAGRGADAQVIEILRRSGAR
jgi:hypothetical protein